MIDKNIFKMIIHNNIHSSEKTILWKIGEVCNINSNIFIPIMTVKCINYRNQNNDNYDLIKVNNIYPVILVVENNGKNMYLIINEYGRKQYWSTSDFEVICQDKFFEVNVYQ